MQMMAFFLRHLEWLEFVAGDTLLGARTLPYIHLTLVSTTLLARVSNSETASTLVPWKSASKAVSPGLTGAILVASFFMETLFTEIEPAFASAILMISLFLR